MARKTVKMTVVFTIPFVSYGPAGDKKAEAQIRRWVKRKLKEHLSYAPLAIEKSVFGGYHDDATGQIKIKIK